MQQILAILASADLKSGIYMEMFGLSCLACSFISYAGSVNAFFPTQLHMLWKKRRLL